jgi:hypothetical protein
MGERTGNEARNVPEAQPDDFKRETVCAGAAAPLGHDLRKVYDDYFGQTSGVEQALNDPGGPVAIDLIEPIARRLSAARSGSSQCLVHGSEESKNPRLSL